MVVVEPMPPSRTSVGDPDPSALEVCGLAVDLIKVAGARRRFRWGDEVTGADFTAVAPWPVATPVTPTLRKR